MNVAQVFSTFSGLDDWKGNINPFTIYPFTSSELLILFTVFMAAKE